MQTTSVCMYVCMNVCMYVVCIYVCMYVCMYVQYRHLVPAPVDRTSVSAWLFKDPWITCQTIGQAHQ